MFRYFTLDNFDFKDKVVGVRVDINSPVINNKVAPNERITQSAITIKDLSQKGAKVIVLAHQGRKGKPDCVSLKEHALLLEKEIGSKVNFISETYSENVKKKIQQLKSGEVLLLENLRFIDDEKNPEKKDNKILKLEKLFDFYVFDAFSVSHRVQTSVVGFKDIPNIAGRIMEKELLGLNNILETKSPHIFVFGGAKPDDLIELLDIDLKLGKIDLAILTGVIGEIALKIKGAYLGKKLSFLKEQGFLEVENKLKDLLEKYPEKFAIPLDVAYIKDKTRVEIPVSELKESNKLLDKYMIQDIGPKSVNYFSSLLKHAGSIYYKGPAGNFEEKGAELGTKGMLNAMTSTSAFTFMGGGHSVTSTKNFGYLDKFSYVSLAGGALVMFLSGKELPGVASLESSFQRFEHLYENFVVVGSNVLDLGISVPSYFVEIEVGDKIKIESDFAYSLGGGGVNVSICLSRLGAKVGYLGKMSTESISQIKEVLDKNKINLIESKTTKRPCAKSLLLDTKDDDRVIFTYRGQNSYLEITDFDINSFRSNNYYFSSLMGKSFETQLELTKKIKKRNPNAIICYNTSSYLINNEPKIKSLIKAIDILILNYEEAQELVGEGSISSCLNKLKTLVSKIVIITDGAHGAYAYDGIKEYFTHSVKPSKIVDTTGAGDSFAGTFFYFYTKGFGLKLLFIMLLATLLV